MTNKMTKRDYFNAIKAIPAVAEDETLLKFIENEIDLLDRKKANAKATKNQIENEGIKERILDVLTLTPELISDFQKRDEILATLSNQKINQLVHQLMEENKVGRKEEKRRAYFYLIEE